MTPYQTFWLISGLIPAIALIWACIRKGELLMLDALMAISVVIFGPFSLLFGLIAWVTHNEEKVLWRRKDRS